MTNFSNLDMTIFVGYLLCMVGFAIYLSFKDKQETAQDYFLASKTLPWWAVGGSLIASNISAEQFIGMSGSGYVVGLAIAAYELMAALTLVLVAKYFLPIFINKGIYTMPQFLEERFDNRVRVSLAIFWVLLFVFVNITSVLYLGGLALESIMGIDMIYGVIGLAIYAATFSIFGGLKTVVWTDVIQVIVLMFGGLLASVLVLQALGGGFFEGLATLYEKAPEKFDLILDKTNAEYANLPGISVLIGGMWIANLYYWGTNQYIIQRSLAAKSLKEAQLGTVFAALVKIVLPLIIVIPGIAAFVLQADIDAADKAYPWVLNNYVSTGFKGLAFAALIAAIGSSLSSMINSTSTIFTLDIYKTFFMTKAASKVELDGTENDNPQLSAKEEMQLVKVGRISSAAALIIGVLVAPMLGGLDQAFQFIQEYTGFISPGIVAVFMLGLFWRKTSANAALWAVILSIPVSVLIKYTLPNIPFMNRMGIVFLLCAAVMVGISMMENKGDDAKAIKYDKSIFHTSTLFNIGAIAVTGILAAIYAIFW